MNDKIMDNAPNESVSSSFTVDMSRRRFLVAASTVAAGVSAGPVRAASRRETYSDLVKVHPSLRGYWRIDGGLVDVMGTASAQAGGAVSFIEGAVGGKNGEVKLLLQGSLVLKAGQQLDIQVGF